MSIRGLSSTSGVSWWSEASSVPIPPTLAAIPTASAIGSVRPRLKKVDFIDSPLRQRVVELSIQGFLRMHFGFGCISGFGHLRNQDRGPGALLIDDLLRTPTHRGLSCSQFG